MPTSLNFGLHIEMSLVYDMAIRDLEPRRDPKGGSPKTPIGGIPVAEFQNYAPLPHPNGTWKTIAGTMMGLLAGMTVAWFTAMSSKGVSQKDMEEYVRQSQADQDKIMLNRNEMHDYVEKYSPWNFDKQSIINRLSSQDQNIGELRAKIDLAAKYLEQQQKK